MLAALLYQAEQLGSHNLTVCNGTFRRVAHSPARSVAARPKLLPDCPGLCPPEVVYVAACRLTESVTTSPSCSAAAEPYSGLPDGW